MNGEGKGGFRFVDCGTGEKLVECPPAPVGFEALF